MWITEYLQLPDQLLDASLAGELVVFAGAGVSMGAPARLPSFQGLAEQIGRESQQAMPEPSEPLDVYLGRLQREGVPVRERARAILHRPRGRSNPLHRSLIGIFGANNPVRIVTTNFDLLFEHAARSRGRNVEIFDAPALPVGDNFEGLVHLHGSFAKEDLSRLVLTDRDFGAAYITDGWASRFLVRAFSEFTVVFVGYSLADPVIRYLAAALPPGTDRYTIISDANDTEEWIARQIVPVTYAATSDHRHLVESIEEWDNHAHVGFLEHEIRIRQIAEAGPPQEPSQVDYLLRALRQERTADFFTRYAQGATWLTWIAGQGMLDPIFDPRATLTGGDRQLMRWYVRHFVLEQDEEAMRILQQNRTLMHPVLWMQIATQLQAPEATVPVKVMSRWITALEGALPDPEVAQHLTALLASPGRLTVQQSLRVFSFLTRPRSSLEASVSWTTPEGAEPAVRGSDELLGDPYWLNEGWKVLSEQISEIADVACIELITNLRALTQAVLDLDDEKFFDRLSWDRSAIEPHEQDGFTPADGWDILVTAIRDCLERAGLTDPALARSLIGVLAREPGLLAQRLAVNAMATAPYLSGDDKLRWILDDIGLYQFGLKHEIFRLLQLAWNDATDEAKDLVVAAAQNNAGSDNELGQYEVYNLLYWLSKLSPPHSASIVAFNSAQDAHSGFAAREHPDFDHWMSAGWDDRRQGIPSYALPEDPRAAAQVLSRPFAEEAERAQLMREARDRAANDSAWAVGLLGGLSDEGAWDGELWSSVVTALAINRPQEHAAWSELISALLSYPGKHLIARDAGRLLEQGIRAQPGQISDSLLPAATSLIAVYWTAAMDANHEPLATTAGWLEQANNSGEGRLLMALLAVCSRQWRLAGEAWQGLPREARELMARTSGEHGHAGQLARAMLGSQVAFLNAADEAWTRETVVPWFVLPQPSAEEAAATWEGFLIWGRWDERLISLLGVYFPELLTLVHEYMPGRADRYIEHLAALYVQSNSPTITPEWLDRFFAAATVPERKAWATEVLGQLPSEHSVMASLWESRLGPLLERRLSGVPLPPAPEELAVMGAWTAHGCAAAESTIEQLTAAGTPAVDGSFLINNVISSEALTASPTAGARLLTWLLTGSDEVTWLCAELAETATRLRDAGATTHSLLDLCEQLARLGCPQAQELRTEFSA